MKMTQVKLFIMGAFCVMFSISSQVEAGTKDSGGDPYVQQFLNRAKKISEYFRANKVEVEGVLDIDEFFRTVAKIDGSIKDESVADLLEFTDEVLKDKDGVTKPAVFNRETGLIRVNREVWKNFNSEERLIQVALEVSGLMGVQDRYQRIERLLRGKAEKIESIPDEAVELYSGVRQMSNANFKVFSSISDKDYLIDGGVMGSGSPQTKDFVEALKDWRRHPDMFNAMIDNLLAGKRVFFVIHSIKGNYASMGFTTIERPDAANGVSEIRFQTNLIHLRKTRPIFDGPCSGEAPTLSTLDRVRQCYLDATLYRYMNDYIEAYVDPEQGQNAADQEIHRMFNEFHDRLVAHYALNVEALRRVLRENLIVDYSMVSRFDHEKEIMEASIRAEKFIPSLVGPFLQSEFWVKTDDEDYRSIRIYKAARFAAENQLLYFDGNFVGREISDDLPLVRGPILLRRDIAEKYLSSGEWSYHSLGMDFEASFYDAFTEAGFWYDSQDKQWKEGEGRSKPVNVDVSLSPFEIVLRAQTERWNFEETSEVYQLIRQSLQSVNGRLEVDQVLLPSLIKLAKDVADLDSIYAQIIKDIGKGDYTLESDQVDVFRSGSVEGALRLLLQNASCSSGISVSRARELFDVILANPTTSTEVLKLAVAVHTNLSQENCEYPFADEILLRVIDHPNYDPSDRAIWRYMMDALPGCVFSDCEGRFPALSASQRSVILKRLVERNQIRDEFMPATLRMTQILDEWASFESFQNTESAKEMIARLGLGATKPLLRWFLSANVSSSSQVSLLRALLDQENRSSPEDYFSSVSASYGSILVLVEFLFSELVEPLPQDIANRILALALSNKPGVESGKGYIRSRITYFISRGSKAQMNLEWESLWTSVVEASRLDERNLTTLLLGLRFCYEESESWPSPEICGVPGAAKHLLDQMSKIDGLSQKFYQEVQAVLRLAE